MRSARLMTPKRLEIPAAATPAGRLPAVELSIEGLFDAADLYRRPRHPYTQALLSAVPVPDPEHKRARIILQGDVPSPLAPPPGCTFHPRCPYAMERCRRETPPLYNLGNGHTSACFLVEEDARKVTPGGSEAGSPTSAGG